MTRHVEKDERKSPNPDEAGSQAPDGEPTAAGKLQQAHAELTAEVADQSEELERANEALQRECAQRKQVELELRASEERFRALARHAPDLTAIIGSDGIYRYVCPAVRDYGFEPEEIVGQPPRDVVHPYDVAPVEADILRATEQPGVTTRMQDFRVRHKDGRYSWLEGSVTCLLDVPGVEGVVFNGHDITVRRALEKRLRQSEKMEAVGQLAGGIAHDFNNQLASVMGNGELLLGRLENEEHRGFAKQIIAGARRAADLTQQLLTFARQAPQRPTAVDLHQIIGDVRTLLDRSVDKRIAIESRLTADRSVCIGDSSLLHSAVLNLALNARDAMPEGGTLTFHTAVVELDSEAAEQLDPTLDADAYLAVSVVDTGTGMDETVRGRMFEPFFTTKPVGEGSGMGLASVYGTVSSHGGAIRVETKAGRGTTMCVCLPLAVDCVPEPTPTPPPTKLSRGARILVVDDEPMVREMLVLVLEDLGHQATGFASGEAALAHFETAWQDVDLVILDLVMPKLGGKEVLLAMQDIDPDVRVVVASGYSMGGEAEALQAHGIVGFVPKPFAVETMARAIEAALVS